MPRINLGTGIPPPGPRTMPAPSRPVRLGVPTPRQGTPGLTSESGSRLLAPAKGEHFGVPPFASIEDTPGGSLRPWPYPDDVSEQGALAALIPVKAFAAGKSRLRSALDDDAREDLAERLALAVIRSCEQLHPHVVCDDDGVAVWAAAAGASVIRVDGPGLNRAVRHGVAELAAAGFERVLIAHADIADPSGLAALAELDGIVLVPDLDLAGTNVLVTPSAFGFSFSYGENSFARHLSEAERSGLPIHVVTDAGLGLDLDDPDDLAAYRERHATTDVSAGGQP